MTPKCKLRSDGNSIDRAIGRHIQLRRVVLGLSRSQLATAVDLTVDELKAFEKGCSSLTPELIVRLSEALGVTVTYFFELLEEHDLTAHRRRRPT